jgi:L-histidine N-alpha-methyltransferase
MFMRPSAALPKPGGPSALHPSAADTQFAGDIEYYLALEPRQLPSRYLYDALGSVLFDAICELPWYGVTRAEFGLLEAHAAEILGHAAASRGLSRIVELGPGNGSKLLTLLQGEKPPARAGRVARPQRREVHLIDVSGKALDQAGQALSALPDIDLVRHETTYEDGLAEVGDTPSTVDGTLILFLGSNLGNFDRPGAEEFLRTIRGAMKPGDSLLLGVDLVKDEAALLLAYDDPLGVTAAFNRNLIVRINRELGGDFDLDAFGHRALWNRAESRVEMHLVSRRRQRVRIPPAHIDITLDEGDTIWTESSYKYEPDALGVLLGASGFSPIDRWIAKEDGFALLLVQAK